MKRILITGENSYVGTAVKEWLQKHADNYLVETIDMIGDSWKKANFSEYDVVYHVAGLAHADVGKVSDETKAFYYKINTELAVETAKKAKVEGVKQFIFMSSMIIYGNGGSFKKPKIITKDTRPNPANFYGDSKLQADLRIQELSDSDFKVVILRPPMIYGKGSKGNYPMLSKMAKKIPVFPKIKNQRSMLYIENLCEFVHLMIENEESGVFFPQNQEYSETSQLVKMIAENTGHHIILTSILNPFVMLMSYIPGKIGGLTNKAFGNLVYEKELSLYERGKYQIISLEKSIERTEH